MKKFLKKNTYNILFVVLIALFIYPPTKVYFIRLFSFSPSIQTTSAKKTQLQGFSLKGLNRSSVNFNDRDDKVIFISFWATWCPPCIAEMPSMKQVYEDYKEKVDFYFVTQESWEIVKKFYDKNEYDFPTYNPVNYPPKEITSSSIPATFIIDKTGNIVVDKKGAADWNSSKIRNLLDQLIAK